MIRMAWRISQDAIYTCDCKQLDVEISASIYYITKLHVQCFGSCTS